MITTAEITQLVQLCLAEDLNNLDPSEGDISAALIPANSTSTAHIISRDRAIFCGVAWGNEVFVQLGGNVTIEWHVKDGDLILPNQKICTLQGLSRDLLTGERTLLNIAQTLSGIATATHRYVQALKGTSTKLLDTRKTIPAMRNATKYAVTCGGGHNHRFGLYDAFLIKENHIAAAGSITNAINQARAANASKLIEVEVENLQELQEALAAKVDRIMLDNFSLEQMKQAVDITNGRAKLESSGNITLERINSVAQTGVDFISVGALTKHINAVDFSMRFKD